MIPQRLDFGCQTNSDYTEEFSFDEGGAFLDLTGHSFEIHVKANPEAPDTLEEFAMAAGPTLEGIYPVEPASGRIQVRFLWETVRALFEGVYPETFEGEGISLYYDLLVTLPSGDREQWLFGFITIRRGITHG